MLVVIGQGMNYMPCTGKRKYFREYHIGNLFLFIYIFLFYDEIGTMQHIEQMSHLLYVLSKPKHYYLWYYYTALKWYFKHINVYVFNGFWFLSIINFILGPHVKWYHKVTLAKTILFRCVPFQFKCALLPVYGSYCKDKSVSWPSHKTTFIDLIIPF